MSDSKQPESMRPIPDGGLQDAMPSWLKRPPAWRNMPTAEERFERTLPEPDTSEIDPKSLVDITDLPQWLQTIAAREPVVVPEPAVEHAVEQVLQIQPEPEPTAVEVLETEQPAEAEELVTTVEPDVVPPEMLPDASHPNTALLWSVIALLVITVLVLGLMQMT